MNKTKQHFTRHLAQLFGEGATTNIAALTAHLAMQKKSPRKPALTSFFCYASRTVRTTLLAVQLINLD